MATRRDLKGNPLGAKRIAVISEKLLDNLSEFPLNISAAITLTANQMRVPRNTVQYMWYGNKRAGVNGLKATNPTLIILTNKGVAINSKNSFVAHSTKTMLTLNKALMDLGSISTEEKVEVFDMMVKR